MVVCHQTKALQVKLTAERRFWEVGGQQELFPSSKLIGVTLALIASLMDLWCAHILNFSMHRPILIAADPSQTSRTDPRGSSSTFKQCRNLYYGNSTLFAVE
jgi:hypothetical protein